MQKRLTRGAKKLLIGLKMEYFRYTMIAMKNKRLGIDNKKIISEIKIDSLIIKSLID